MDALNLAAAYPWLKVLHILATSVWIGGQFLYAGLLARWTRSPAMLALARPMHGTAMAAINTAMLLVAALGLTLAALLGRTVWSGSGWIAGKLVILVLLGAVHGLLIGQAKALLKGVDVAPGRFRGIQAATLLLALAAIALAVFKPG